MKIIGIGASAGGIDALSKFLNQLPSKLGAAFVVVKHLPSDRETVLEELMAKETTYPVVAIEADVMPEADTIYVNPPGHELIYEEDMLRPVPEEPGALPNYPIDRFLRSLGVALNKDAIAIILSGAGSDGARGARVIKERGGLVMVQAPESAQFEQMPRSILRLDIADHSLPPAGLADKLAQILDHAQGFPKKKALINLEAKADKDHFDRILSYLKNFSELDFRQYRESTLIRRLEKRMLLHEAKKLEDYFNTLNGNRKEMVSLFHDFIINVTQFFRDPEVFELLASEIIPQIIDNSHHEKTIRMWVPACSTGEEAYTIAMLLDHHLKANGDTRDFKIFGSDVSQKAINFAAAGLYPRSIEADIPADLLSTYFTPEDDHYRVRKSLRSKLLFAVQDVLRDPPFIRMDLISCRNLLIYLKEEAQRSALATFHFALNADGFLLLGSSESTGKLKYAFQTIKSRWSIFQKKEDSRVPNFTSQERNMERLQWNPPVKAPPEPGKTGAIYLKEETTDPFTRFLVDRYAPVSIFLNENLDIYYINGEVDHILKIPRALARMNLSKMIDKEDLAIFRAGVNRALKSEELAVFRNQTLSKNDQKFNLHFRKIAFPESDDLIIQVEIEPSTKSSVQLKKESEGEEIDQITYLREQVGSLEKELETARKQTIELVRELETTNEELESSNRELLASNEELQSTNLELQSINEELYSVNSEMQVKNSELTLANNDLKNLLRSTGIGTIFLDNNLNIRRFTPAVRKQFNLIDTDIGRPITDFATTFDNLDIGEICQEVFQTLNSYEKEVSDDNGNHYLLRILPYRTEEDEIKGLVLTFVDINELIKAREYSARKAEKFKTIFENSHNTIILLNEQLQVTSANRDFGPYSPLQLESNELLNFIPSDYRKKVRNHIDAAFKENRNSRILLSLPNAKRNENYYDMTFFPSFVESIHSSFVMIIAQDVTLRELLKREVSLSLSQYQNFVEQTKRPIALINSDGEIIQANLGFRSMYETSQPENGNFYNLIPEKDRKKIKRTIKDIFEGIPYEKVEFEMDGRLSSKHKKLSLIATPVIIEKQVRHVALISKTEIE